MSNLLSEKEAVTESNPPRQNKLTTRQRKFFELAKRIAALRHVNLRRYDSNMMRLHRIGMGRNPFEI
jgi:hypothetical protein